MLTQEDKAVISDYMGWFKHIYFYRYDEPIYFQEGVAGDIVFDPNDASLCVSKMVENGDWEDFESFVGLQQALEYAHNPDVTRSFYIYMNDNFFQAMAGWLKYFRLCAIT
jgi:hypothetical protein